MAATPEADALTDDYRRRQAQLGAYMLAQLGGLWPKLDPRRLDDTRGPWLRAVAGLVAQGHTASATLAAAYLPAFRALERVPGEAPAVPLAVPDLDRIIRVQAYLGPIRHLERLRGGADPDESWRIARNQTIAAGHMHVLDGGRAQTLATVERDNRALGWVRVCSASSCAFCSMLASRGPAYKGRRSASFRAHPGCNCTAEPSYDLDRQAWPPRARILAEEWQTVTRGLSGDDARLAWRRHTEGRAGALDAAGRAAADTARAAGRMERVTDPTTTQAGRGAQLPRDAAATKTGRGRTLTRAADPNAPAVRAASAEAQLRGLRTTLARLEARAAAGEDVATALKWQRDRIAALEAELGPEAAARVAAETADTAAAAARQAGAEATLNAQQAAARAAAERQAADKARAAAQAAADREAAELAARRAAEADRVRAEEETARAQAEAAAAGAEVDEAGVPWRLTGEWLADLDDAELDSLTDYLAEGLATGNPVELERWEDLDLWLTYRQAYDDVVGQAGRVPDEQITRELADLMATRGKVGLTHTAAELDDLLAELGRPSSRPTRRQVQDEYAIHVEELYVRAEAATRGVLVNAKGAARGISGRSLMTGDVRRVLRYGSPELLEFFESNRRVQFAEFYAERTGSQAFAELAARQARRNAGIDRDRSGFDLVANREA